MWIDAKARVGELGEVGSADNDRADVFQSFDDWGIPLSRRRAD